MADVPEPGESSVVDLDDDGWDSDRLAALHERLIDSFLDPVDGPDGVDDRVHVVQSYANMGLFDHPDLAVRHLDHPPEWVHHVASLVAVLQEKMRELDDEYGSDDALDFYHVVSLEVYRQIAGIRNYPQLRSHLLRAYHREGIPVYQMLGLSDVPHPNTLRKASKRRFNRHTSEFIKRWARILERIAIERGYAFPDVAPRRLSNNGGVVSIPVELKRGYAQGALDLARDNYPVEKSPHALWDDYGIHFDYSLWLCQTGGTPEGELENFADARGLQKGVDLFSQAETFRTDLGRVSIQDWERTIGDWTEDLIDTVYPDSLRSRELPLAIDETNIPTWAGEQSDLDGVTGTQKLSNTHYAYRITTAQAVSDGMAFQVAHTLQQQSGGGHERLESLLQTVEDRGFNVGIILADSEFATGRVVNMLKGRDVDFVIAYPKHYVKGITDDWEAEGKRFGVQTDYTMSESKSFPVKATVNLFGAYQSKLSARNDDDEAQQTLSQWFDVEPEYVTGDQDQTTIAAFEDFVEEDIFEADNKMRWFTFITNLDVGERGAKSLRSYYHYRWAIESAYKDIKGNFLPGTRSTDLGIRTYLYLFGIYAYNAWVAANTKARRQHLQDSPRKRPPIRASRFMNLAQQRYRTDEFHTDYVNFRE